MELFLSGTCFRELNGSKSADVATAFLKKKMFLHAAKPRYKATCRLLQSFKKTQYNKQSEACYIFHEYVRVCLGLRDINFIITKCEHEALFADSSSETLSSHALTI